MKKINTILLFFLSGTIFILNGQNPVREVDYDTYTYNMYAVPTNTDMESLTDMDLTKLMNEDKRESVNITINSSNEITITRLFNDLPQYKYNYQKMNGKIVSNKDEINIYNREGDIVKSEESENPEQYLINEDEIANYGTTSIFDVEMSDIQEDFEQSEFEVVIMEEGEISAINDSIEVYIDPNRLLVEYLFFDDDILKRSYSEMHVVVNNYHIPKANVTTTFETLFSGTRCQRSEVVHYESYYVTDEDGETIVEYSSEAPVQSGPGKIKIRQFKDRKKKNLELKIHPNPVDDILEVELPYILSEYINMQIIDATGNVIIEEENLISGSRNSINVSNLEQGIYFIKAGNSSKWKTSKFIKL
ncbi:MAG: T9SS type A sorting domain-containing protein [Bacteroidales bacterium]